MASTPSIARRSGSMVTASGLRFAATLAALGFLGFFEVGIGRQSPHPGSGRINVKHGSGQRPQGQASVDDEHEREKAFRGIGPIGQDQPSAAPEFVSRGSEMAAAVRITSRGTRVL